MLCPFFKSHDKVKEEKKKNQPKSKHSKLSSGTKNFQLRIPLFEQLELRPNVRLIQRLVSSGVWTEAPTHRPYTWQRVSEIERLVSRQDSRTFSPEDTRGELVKALSLDSSQPGFQGQLYNVTLSSWFHLLYFGFFVYKLRTVLFGSQPCCED